MKTCAWLLLCVLFTAPLSALARTWTDTQGHTVEGEFNRVVKGRVLINVGDRTIQVPFGRLIAEDQDFVRDQLKAHGLQDQVPAKKKTADADAATDTKPSAKEAAAKETNAEAPAKLGPTRTWTDVRGRSIQARFLGMEGALVRLQFKGKNTSFPFDKFSLADQQYVRGEMVARGEGDKVPAETPVQAQPVPNQPPVRGAPQFAQQGGPPAFHRHAWPTGPRPAAPAMPQLPQIQSPAFTPPPQSQIVQQPPVQPPPMRSAPFMPPAPPPVVNFPAPNFAPNMPNNPLAPQQVMTMGKICSNCRHVLPSTITAGDRCPNCGVLIAYDETNGKKAYWVYFATPGGIGAVIGMVIYAFRRAQNS